MPRQAAIDLDDLAEKTPDQISVTDFLAALDRDNLATAITPEEKKGALLPTVPEAGNDVRVCDIFDVIRSEKKKFELEKPPGFERLRDPRDAVINALVFDRLVERLTDDVAVRLAL